MNQLSTPGEVYPTGESDRFRTLVEAVTDYAIYMLDPSGIVISWNAGAERFKGYRAPEIIGLHFSRFYTDEDRAADLPARALDIAVREGKFEAEGWRVRKDGTRFWAHVVIDPIRDPSGRLTGFAKITRDLTERKKAEELLRRSEQQFRILVQGVTDYAIYMLDPQGRVSSWNAGAQRIKGYAAEEIVGKHFSQFYAPEDREAGKPGRALETAVREGRFESEGWRVRKDGTRFWSHVVIDSIRGDDGELLGFAKITRDITERKQAQEALDRTREALFQSQKMDAVGQLTGGVAHDFNNLLMAILGSLELLRKRLPDDPRLLRLVDNAMMGAQRGATLTQRMLSFARRQQMDVRPLDLQALVREMTDLLQSTIGTAAEIQTQFPASPTLVVADTNQLELALLNLCVNARDAMKNGGRIVVSVRAEQFGENNAAHLAPGRYVCLSVRDNGEGMSSETVARATEPFFTTKGVGKGTGLGLSMVHGMAEQVGGRLFLKSKLGEGTTAEIWLPAFSGANDSSAAPAPAAGADAAARPLRVLAVDDDRLVLFNTSAMLEELGHTVTEANSGEDALALLAQQSFDLVIADQAMPRMTGIQLMDAIRERWPGLPMILATGYAEIPGDVKIELPILSKPFSENELARALRAVAR
jgi:PAS domain S-box-containing protein